MEHMSSDNGNESAEMFIDDAPLPPERMKPYLLRLSLYLLFHILLRVAAMAVPDTVLRQGAVFLSFLIPAFVFYLAEKCGKSPKIDLPPKIGSLKEIMALFPCLIAVVFSVSLLLSPIYGGADLFGDLPPVLRLVMTVILPAVSEELFCRGCVYKLLLPAGRRNAILFSSLLFALLHAGVSQTVYAFLAGIVLAVAACASRSVIFPMIFHAGLNLFSFSLMYIPDAYRTVAVLAAIVIATVFSVFSRKVIFRLYNGTPHNGDGDTLTYAKIIVCSPFGVLLILLLFPILR